MEEERRGGSVLRHTLALLAAHVSKSRARVRTPVLCNPSESCVCLSCRLLTNEGKLLSQREKQKQKHEHEMRAGEDVRKQKKTKEVNDGEVFIFNAPNFLNW